MAKRALSLAESVVSMFLLMAGSLACLTLCIQAQRYQSDSLQAQRAAQLSSEVLERVRQWAKDTNNFNSSWATYNDDTFTHPHYPEFRIRVQCASTQQTIYSPSQSTEQTRLLGGRQLAQARPVKVTVEWGRQRSHHLDVRLYEEARVVRSPLPITVTLASGSTNPLAQDGSLIAEGHLWDSSGQEILGVPFRWSTSTNGTGLATLDNSQDPSDRSIRLFHWVYEGDPGTSTKLYLPGNITILATARYQGREYTGGSPEVTLEP